MVDSTSRLVQTVFVAVAAAVAIRRGDGAAKAAASLVLWSRSVLGWVVPKEVWAVVAVELGSR